MTRDEMEDVFVRRDYRDEIGHPLTRGCEFQDLLDLAFPGTTRSNPPRPLPDRPDWSLYEKTFWGHHEPECCIERNHVLPEPGEHCDGFRLGGNKQE